MNADRLIRMVMRRLMSRGVNAGINRMNKGQGQHGLRGQQAQHNTRRARQALRLLRRFGRF